MQQDNAVALRALDDLRAHLLSCSMKCAPNSKEIKTFVQNTLYRFWTHDLSKCLEHYVATGTCVGEVMYEKDSESGLWKYAGLDDFEMNDVQALRSVSGRHLTGARISAGGISVPGLTGWTESETGVHTNELRHPKLFWLAHRAICANLWGHSTLDAAWNPWMEKVGSHVGNFDSQAVVLFQCVPRLLAQVSRRWNAAKSRRNRS